MEYYCSNIFLLRLDYLIITNNIFYFITYEKFETQSESFSENLLSFILTFKILRFKLVKKIFVSKKSIKVCNRIITQYDGWFKIKMIK